MLIVNFEIEIVNIDPENNNLNVCERFGKMYSSENDQSMRVLR